MTTATPLRPTRPASPLEVRPSRASIVVSRIVTSLLVIAPVVVLAILIPLLWGHAVTLPDIVLAVVLFGLTGHGIAIGFHRLFTHSGFVPSRPLKIALASIGSMALEGSVIGWVANHRRHHMFSDRPGDPHSPHRFGGGAWAQTRGFLYAHVGWLFAVDTTSAERFAPDLLDDPDLVAVSRLFPVFAVASLAVPFVVGWLWAGTIGGALTAFVWAGLVRMVVLHHVTWSVNSICHVFGRQPFTQKDRSTNFAPLALLSFGESWHNFHHAHPSSARHGAKPRQLDSSAAIIRLFEQLGWATKVRWPTAAQLGGATP